MSWWLELAHIPALLLLSLTSPFALFLTSLLGKAPQTFAFEPLDQPQPSRLQVSDAGPFSPIASSVLVTFLVGCGARPKRHYSTPSPYLLVSSLNTIVLGRWETLEQRSSCFTLPSKSNARGPRAHGQGTKALELHPARPLPLRHIITASIALCPPRANRD
jgi:hypothetical protein